MTPAPVRWKAEGRKTGHLEAPRAENLQNRHNIALYPHPEGDREGKRLRNRHLLRGALRVVEERHRKQYQAEGEVQL